MILLIDESLEMRLDFLDERRFLLVGDELLPDVHVLGELLSEVDGECGGEVQGRGAEVDSGGQKAMSGIGADSRAVSVSVEGEKESTLEDEGHGGVGERRHRPHKINERFVDIGTRVRKGKKRS